MRKVWYHKIWIQTDLLFTVLIQKNDPNHCPQQILFGYINSDFGFFADGKTFWDYAIFGNSSWNDKCLTKISIATSKWLSPKYHVLLFFQIKFSVVVKMIWRKHSWFFFKLRMCIPQENILACRKICQQIFGLKKMKPSRKFTRATMGQFLNRFKKT